MAMSVHWGNMFRALALIFALSYPGVSTFEILHEASVLEGMSANFICTSGPEPTYFTLVRNLTEVAKVQPRSCTTATDVNYTTTTGKYSFECIHSSNISWTIHNVTLESNNTIWACQIIYGSYQFFTNGIRLQVLIPPEQPEIVNAVSSTVATGQLGIWAHENQTITLECVSRAAYPLQTVGWYNGTVDSEPLDSSETVIAEENGTFTVWSRLTLVPTLADDRNRYVCQSSFGRNPVIVSNTTVELRVVASEVPPLPPVITNTTETSNGTLVIWGQVDQEVVLECVSMNGYPQQTVRWYNGTGDDQPLATEVETVTDGVNGTFTVWSRLTLIPTLVHDTTSYVCQSTFDSDPVMVSNTTVELRLAAQPQTPVITNATRTSNGTYVVWGQCDQELTLQCVSIGGHPQQTVAWYNGTVDTEALASEETVTEVNGTFTVWIQYTFTPAQNDENTTFICQSSSTTAVIETLQTTVHLHLHDKHKETDGIRVTDRTLIREGTSKTFTCTAAFSPSYFTMVRDHEQIGVIRWKDCSAPTGIDTLRYTFACPTNRHLTWTIRNVTRDYNNTIWACGLVYFGPYKQYTNGILLQVLITPKRPEIPQATTTARGHSVVYGEQNSSLTIECISRNSYPRQTVDWYKYAADVLAKEPLASEETVTEMNGTFTVWSRLTLFPTLDDDRATFVCQSSVGALIDQAGTSPVGASRDRPDRVNGVTSKRAVELHLVVLPNHPEITSSGTTIVWGQVGVEITLECISRNGYPRQNVHWYSESTDSEPLVSEESMSQANGKFTVWSRYTFIPGQTDDKSTYVCHAASPGTGYTYQSRVELHLKDQSLGGEMNVAALEFTDTAAAGTANALPNGFIVVDAVLVAWLLLVGNL